ncbi:hypothetical protein [Teredinibacter franksiae]|uniref:hypothetical protein n=1 Tax=Teredinibacter franksiae TaxID=2761453 RepID=UPI001626BCCA|nr:hypothetical protein [Teredinibacter franksiae]
MHRNRDAQDVRYAVSAWMHRNRDAQDVRYAVSAWMHRNRDAQDVRYAVSAWMHRNRDAQDVRCRKLLRAFLLPARLLVYWQLLSPIKAGVAGNCSSQNPGRAGATVQELLHYVGRVW